MAGIKKAAQNEKSFRFIVIAIAVIILIFMFLGIASVTLQYIGNMAELKGTGGYIEPAGRFISTENATMVSMSLPAVDEDGNGVVTLLGVEATKGTGRTLVDIENILFWADTQHSIRQARLVAGNITGKNLNYYDLVYSVVAQNASVVGGPSAGAALTIATIAAIEGKPLKTNVMITGTINHDGTLGPVSGILEKAKAAKSAGASIFIVPLLQSGDIVYETEEYCEDFGGTEICTTETRPKKVNVAEEAGLEVIEVSSVQDALEHFFE